MSYQEYTQLGKGTRRKAQGDGLPRNRGIVDRPYNRTTTSFSVPRQSPMHSSSSSTSSATLSPSNSASQKDASSPTAAFNDGRDVGSHPGHPNHLTLAQLKELELAVATEKKPNLVDVELPWRPSYLRRRILAAFAGIFVILIVALEVLGDLSNRNGGLGNGETLRNTRFAWMFLPVLALIGLAGMWTRVDYQAKAAAPWIRMSRGPAPAEKTLLLDYVNMSLPVSIVRAVLNRDVVVACTSMVSLLLGLLVVVSTALLTLSLVDVPHQNARIALNTAFVDDASRLAEADSYPFLAMVGLQQDNLSYPDGVSSRYAYQQFSAEVPFGTEIRATVDGFSGSLDCEAAQLSLVDAQYNNTGVQLNTTLSIPDCSVDMPVFSKEFLGASPIFYARFSHGGCGGSNDPQDQRILVVFGSGSVDSTSMDVAKNSTEDGMAVNATVSQSMQLICKPTYAISRLDARKNQVSLIDLDLADTDTRTLSSVQPWDIAQSFFDSYYGALVGNFSDTNPSTYPEGSISVDAPMYLALGLRAATSGNPVPLSALLDRTTLESVAVDYFQQYTALMASRSLMEESSSSTTGTIMLRGERLLVRSLAVQLMVILLGVSLVLTVVTMCFAPRKGFLPRDPNTIIDTAALIVHSRPLLQSLRGAGGGTEKLVRNRLSGNHYFIGVEAYEHGASSDPGYFKIFGTSNTTSVNADYAEETGKYIFPINLHPLVRIVSFLGVLVIIILLEVTLRASLNNAGLTDVMDDTYFHLLWTAMPALILSHFATYFASVDFTTRALAPYVALKEGNDFHHTVNMNYLDKTAPLAIYESFKHRDFAVATAGIALLMSSLFVAIAAPLFSEVTIPANTAVRLLSQDFFMQNTSASSSVTCPSCQDGLALSSLILNGNLSYPSFTYEDLNFPTMMLDTNQEASTTFPADITISASLPAIRPSMACRIFKQSELMTTLSTNYNVPDGTNSLRVDFVNETGNTLVISTGRRLAGTMAQVQAIDPNPFFGTAAYKPLILDNGTTVSHWVYAWGQLANADTNQTTVLSISGMSCNESLEQVTAMATFYGTSLAILPSDPPVVDQSSAAPLTLGLASGWDYSELADISTGHLLDEFFASLVASRYAVPVETLGDWTTDAAQRTADAITFQHKLIRAQVINTSGRQPITNTSTTPIPIGAGPALDNSSSPLTFPATATSNTVTTTTPRQQPPLLLLLHRAPSPTTSSSSSTTPLSARRRLTQDTPSTRALQALLAATAALSAASWLLGRHPANVLPRPRSAASIASVAALLADGNTFGLLGRAAEWSSTVPQLRAMFLDGLHVAMGFRLGWETPRRPRRPEAKKDGGGLAGGARVFGVSAVRTGGWGGGEGVGLGLQARVGYVHRRHVGDWGWRT